MEQAAVDRRSTTFWRETLYPCLAYLQYATEDAVAGLRQDGQGADAFEALVAAPDLQTFLANDDGLMISRLTRTREALTLYAEHLRQLARTA